MDSEKLVRWELKGSCKEGVKFGRGCMPLVVGNVPELHIELAGRRLGVDGEELARQILNGVYKQGLDFGRYYANTGTGLDLEKLPLTVDKALLELLTLFTAIIYKAPLNRLTDLQIDVVRRMLRAVKGGAHEGS